MWNKTKNVLNYDICEYICICFTNAERKYSTNIYKMTICTYDFDGKEVGVVCLFLFSKIGSNEILGIPPTIPKKKWICYHLMWKLFSSLRFSILIDDIESSLDFFGKIIEDVSISFAFLVSSPINCAFSFSIKKIGHNIFCLFCHLNGELK